MDTQTAVTTLRSTARNLVIEQVSAAAYKDHERNYEKLHINRDGSINWSELINKSDDIIDRFASHFSAIPSVITVGTGSCSCNCDWCNEIGKSINAAGDVVDDDDEEFDPKTEITQEDAINGAVGDESLCDLEEQMLAAFDKISDGYFDDEDDE